MRNLSILASALLLVPSVCDGNIGFMPGDAFFHSRLTQAVAESASPEKPLTLSYDPPPFSGGFGGYAGFQKLEITGVSHSMTNSLKEVYSELRKFKAKELRVDVSPEGVEVPVETNGFHLFVYPRDAEWKIQRFGLKYNENWMDLPEDAFAGANREGFARVPAEVYSPFVRHYCAVAEDWKYCRRFAALPVTVPDSIGWGLLHTPINVPVSISADDVQIVILRFEVLRMYFNCKNRSDFFCITKHGSEHWRWCKRGLQRVADTKSLGTFATQYAAFWHRDCLFGDLMSEEDYRNVSDASNWVRRWITVPKK